MTAPFDSLAEETRRQSKRSSKMQALIPQPLGKRTVADGLIEKAPRMAGLESIMQA
jgi:hypothetical protein